MDCRDNLIIVKGVIATWRISRICPDGQICEVTYNSGEVYNYNLKNIVWLKNPKRVDISNCRIFVKGRCKWNVEEVWMFEHGYDKYYTVLSRLKDDNRPLFEQQCKASDLVIIRSCLSGKSLKLYNYFRRCSSVCTIGKDKSDHESKSILERFYSKDNFVNPLSVASVYLNHGQKIGSFKSSSLLFPFGCNSSQMIAVQKALDNQLSVIQGPPGTGKTQTILNIIANLLADNKSILVVSSNNAATLNVLEKLKKYGLDFLVAPLGKKENKEAFIANQPPLNPELRFWKQDSAAIGSFKKEVFDKIGILKEIFSSQELLASYRQELADISLEKYHFDYEFANDFTEFIRMRRVSSAKVLKYWRQLYDLAEIKTDDYRKGPWNFIVNLRKIALKFKCKLYLKLPTMLTDESLPQVIIENERLFYYCRISELTENISALEKKLSGLNASEISSEMTSASLSILKSILADRFDMERKKWDLINDIIVRSEDFLKDYPIVLSTTFSAKSCVDDNSMFDYVIMDEASQVSIETGVLALTCARNAVIVGDTKQLPNVISEEDVEKLNDIRSKLDSIKGDSNVPDCYDCATHSFLSSVLEAVPNVPQTLLREHYRCHPDIINFCNQKFYGGQLLIMTERGDNTSPFMLMTTSEGNHAKRVVNKKGIINQREIDVIKSEIIPKLEFQSDLGIIAPYNLQVEQIKECIAGVEADTIHKFQGREKSTIIFSVTDNRVSEFSDNANLINVAVSRAKDKFCLVMSGNEQNLKGNIYDLQRYIKYRNGEVLKSSLHSIFDYLHSQIRSVNCKYKSEELTLNLITEILQNNPRLNHLKCEVGYRLGKLISDKSLLDEEEKRYVNRYNTHVDFLIFNSVTKEAVLAIETNGFTYHNKYTKQYHKDLMKDRLLSKYGLKVLRLSTVGHSEELQIINELSKALNVSLQNNGIGASLHVASDS